MGCLVLSRTQAFMIAVTTNHGVNANPVYLMLNTAVGGAGSWPGAPDLTTVFPNDMDIDYVRLYQ